MATSSATARVGAALRKHALSYPEVHEDFPWGERALKVKKKVFLFLHYDAHHLALSVKLLHSSGVALMFSFAEPTGYGLGKAGWVTARFARGSRPPLSLLQGWLKESYACVAPAKLVALAASQTPRRAATNRRRRPSSRPSKS
jgi:predicted DNA-binding protein (MmcQ/YjbR family)